MVVGSVGYFSRLFFRIHGSALYVACGTSRSSGGVRHMKTINYVTHVTKGQCVAVQQVPHVRRQYVCAGTKSGNQGHLVACISQVPLWFHVCRLLGAS
jgi:hypothetical protein